MQLIKKLVDQILCHGCIDDIKWEELEKVCKKEKDHKVQTRMVVVRMVRVLDMSVEETASLQVWCSTWVRDWLYSYDEGGLDGLRDLSRYGIPYRSMCARWT